MPGPRAQQNGVVAVKREDIERREDGAMPVDVESFLLVGRKVVKTVGVRTVPGVIRMWRPTFGAGQQHDGLRVRYHPNPLKQERPEDTQPMDTDFTFFVAWEGSEQELEELSLEEAQVVATQEWCDDFLPEALRRLVKGGPGGGFDWELWEKLDGSKAAQTYLVECEEAERKERGKRQAAATRACKKAAGLAGRATAAAPRATAKRTGGAPGKKPGAAAKKASEPAPLRAPEGVADFMQAKAAAKRKRQEEARAAAAAAAASGQGLAPSPAKKSKVLGDLAPRSCISPPVAAAAAARVVPSGQGSPSSRGAGAAPPSRRKQQHPTAVASDSVADSSSWQWQQQEAAQQQQKQRAEQEERQQRQAAGRSAARAPSTGRTKQQTLSPTKSGKSRGSGGRSTGGKKQVAPVLRQDEVEPVAPADSARLLQDEARWVKLEQEQDDVVFWYDRVKTQDNRMFRAYSCNLILPEGACLRSKDRKLRSWKGKVLGDNVEYDVERLLAEKEGEDGEARYLVKWAGFEADPAPDSWLDEGALANSQSKLQEWQSRGRAEWIAMSRAVLREAGMEQA